MQIHQNFHFEILTENNISATITLRESEKKKKKSSMYVRIIWEYICIFIPFMDFTNNS